MVFEMIRQHRRRVNRHGSTIFIPALGIISMTGFIYYSIVLYTKCLDIHSKSSERRRFNMYGFVVQILPMYVFECR